MDPPIATPPIPISVQIISEHNPFLQAGNSDGGDMPQERSTSSTETQEVDGFVLLSQPPLNTAAAAAPPTPTPPPRAQVPTTQTAEPASGAAAVQPTPPARGAAPVQTQVITTAAPSTNPFAAAAAADAAVAAAAAAGADASTTVTTEGSDKHSPPPQYSPQSQPPQPQPHTTSQTPQEQPPPQQQPPPPQTYYVPPDADARYSLSWGSYLGKRAPVICQNQNGPCPLLALCNVLLLRGAIELRPNQAQTTFEELVSLLSEYLLRRADTLPEGPVKEAFQVSMNSCLELFPTLQAGLDVNVKFTGVDGFEFTPQLDIFDTFGVNLYHGWLCDPAHPAKGALGALSFNQLLDVIVSSRCSSSDLSNPPDPETQSKGLLAQEWLQESQSQLTYHGLCELHAGLNSNELGIFFRNNHFNVLHKHASNNALYLLVTDQGFLETSVMWETLANVDGDSNFLDNKFMPLHGGGGGGGGGGVLAQQQQGQLSPRTQEMQDIARAEALSRQDANRAAAPPAMAMQSAGAGGAGGAGGGGGGGPQTDAELARMLQAQEQQQQAGGGGAGAGASAGVGAQRTLPRSDSELARMLQQEEQAMYNQQQQHPPQRDVVATPQRGKKKKKKDGDCIIC